MKLGDVPAFRTLVGTGRCHGNKIETACKAAGMKPLCDNPNSGRTGKCVGLKESKYAGMYFSHPGSHGNALYNTGSSHQWVNLASGSSKFSVGDRTWTVADQDRDGWYTFCTVVPE